MASLKVGWTFPNSKLLTRVTGYFEELAVPRSYEILNWFSRISVIRNNTKSFIENGYLKRNEYHEGKDAILLDFEYMVVERLTWYYPNETTRRETDKVIAECAELFVKIQEIYSNDQESSFNMVELPQITNLKKEEIFRLKKKLERMLVSYLRSFYDTKWRTQCVILVEDYTRKQSIIRNKLDLLEMPYSCDFIRLKALLQTLAGLTNGFQEEHSKDPKEIFQQAVLVGMGYSARKILAELEVTEFTPHSIYPMNLNRLVEETEHLAAKFLYLKLPTDTLLKIVAVEILCIFKKLRRMGFYDISELSAHMYTRGRNNKLRLSQMKVKIEFAKKTMAELIILVIKSIEQSLKSAPILRKMLVLEKWKANSQLLIDEYEAWDMKNSSFSPVLYHVHRKICDLG